MPVRSEGDTPAGRRWPRASLCLILPLIPLGAALVPFAHPVYIQLGRTAVEVRYTRADSPEGGWWTFDSPPLRNYPYATAVGEYELEGIGHIRYVQAARWGFWLAWCRGRRVK